MKRAVVTVAAVVVTLLLASAAWAACAQSDLTGTWMTYQSGVTGDGFFYWQRCTVTLNSTGLVTGGSCRDDAGQAFTLTAGRIRVTSACVVTGTAGGSGGVSTINHGALDKGKTVFMGVLTDPDNGIASIQGVKK